jgi:hypothetical protein
VDQLIRRCCIDRLSWHGFSADRNEVRALADEFRAFQVSEIPNAPLRLPFPLSTLTLRSGKNIQIQECAKLKISADFFNLFT